MNILVLNCGSSTLKFQIIETEPQMIEEDADRCLAKGVVERIGSQALMTFEPTSGPRQRLAEPVRNHRDAIDKVLRWIVSPTSGIDHIASLADINAVGHRVVHGGEHFQRSVLINAEVIDGIEDCIELAPLHNPANLKGIEAAVELLGTGLPQVAVFDTSFHSTMPEEAYLYGLPYQYYRRYKIRRYGFHGTSHRYVAYRFRKLMNLEHDEVNIITLHLGNGCSACAIKGGYSIDTSMGFTPVEGLLMGTRSGDLDPSVLEYLHHKEGLSFDELDTMLNKRSGLLGLSGLTSDMRELLEEEAENQDRRARLAINIFCRRVARYIGAYFVEMGGAAAVVFTGGIGENSPPIRERICRDLVCLGLDFDHDLNRSLSSGTSGTISKEGCRLAGYVIPTNEELLIARDTLRVIEDLPRRW